MIIRDMQIAEFLTQMGIRTGLDENLNIFRYCSKLTRSQLQSYIILYIISSFYIYFIYIILYFEYLHLFK